MGKNKAVIGTQWGDEGKGKIIDWLSEDADGIVRFQGANNAGHSAIITLEGITHSLKYNLIPSGYAHHGKWNLMAAGEMIDLAHLVKEQKLVFNELEGRVGELLLDLRACVTIPYHIGLDKANNAHIGTTNRGVGPAHEDRAGRRAIRILDFENPETLKQKIIENTLHANHLLLIGKNHVEQYDPNKVFDEVMEAYQKVKGFTKIIDGKRFLAERVNVDNQTVLFELSQGYMLDNILGTFPMVTSSRTIASEVTAGTGVYIELDNRIGVVKAYTTRVGNGHFTTELTDDIGRRIQEVGKEVGTTTGRTRRCGWVDLVPIYDGDITNKYTELNLTKLDVLTGIPTIKVCTAYELDGSKIEFIPPNLSDYERVKPVYIELPGWTQDITGVRDFDKLPQNAQRYVDKIENLVNIPIRYIGTGPERNDMIIRN